MTRNITFFAQVATFCVAFILTGCPPMSGPALTGTCTDRGATAACSTTCIPSGVQHCLPRDGAAGGPLEWTNCGGPDVCVADTGVPAMDGGMTVADSGPTDSGMTMVDAGTDAGSPPVDAGTDGGMVSADAGPTGSDAGPTTLCPDGPVRGCTNACGVAGTAGVQICDPLVGYGICQPIGMSCTPVVPDPLDCPCVGVECELAVICRTECNFSGVQTLSDWCADRYCWPLFPSLEMCMMTDAGTPDGGTVMTDSGSTFDAGTDAATAVDAFVAMDAGTDAFVAPDAFVPVDAGTDSGPPPVDAGTDAFVPPVDAGTDAFVPMDAGSDAGPPDAGPPDAGRDGGTDSGVADAGSSGSDAGRDAGPSWDPGSIPGSGVYGAINPSVAWCPTGGVPEIRLWDNNNNDIPNADEMHLVGGGLTAPVGAGGVELINSTINTTVYCRTGSGLYMGYYSPVVTGATNGNDSEVIGMRVWINGIEVPAFSCWDTQYAYSVSPRSSDFRRVLFQATLDPAQMLMSCAPGTLLP